MHLRGPELETGTTASRTMEIFGATITTRDATRDDGVPSTGTRSNHQQKNAPPQQNVSLSSRSGLQEWWERDGKSDLKIYGTSLALALVVRSVALEPRFIPSLSMFPTFEIGDQLAVDKLSNKLSRPYQRKDVVVFYPPPKFSEFSNRGKNDVRLGRW